MDGGSSTVNGGNGGGGGPTGGNGSSANGSDLQYATMQSLYATQQSPSQPQQAFSNMAQYIALQAMSVNSGIPPLQTPQMTLASLGQPPTGEEPLYVNAKQYHRIIKRREARSRQEAFYKAAKKEKAKETTKGYIHESRHKHAMRRPRGPGGRFLSASEMAALEAKEKTESLLHMGSDQQLPPTDSSSSKRTIDKTLQNKGSYNQSSSLENSNGLFDEKDELPSTTTDD